MSLEARLKQLQKELKPLVRDPHAHVSYAARGKLELIKEIGPEVCELEDELWEVKDNLKKLQEANYRRDCHSGYGRGDSCG